MATQDRIPVARGRGISLAIPPGWVEVDAGGGRMAPSVALASTTDTCLAIITVSEIGNAGSLPRWSTEALAGLATLPAVQILDHVSVVVGTMTSRRVLAHYLSRRGGRVIETWILPFRTRPLVLSCCTSPVDYDALVPTFAAVAQSVAVDGAA